MPQYTERVIPSQVAILLKSIKHCQIVINTKDCPSHTVHVHTLYLLWELDVMTLKVVGLTEPQKQLRQHIHWNILQRSILNTSVTVCRHWVEKQELNR